MLADARNVPEGTELETDFCIIGAGAAGITLARALIGSPIRIVVLESGGLGFDAATQELCRGSSVGLPYFPLETARLRYFGGSTNHWGGLCAPFHAEDFERREWIPFSGWPIERSDLDPYYPRAREAVHLSSDEWSVRSWDRRDSQFPLDLGSRTEPRVAQMVDSHVRSFGSAYRDEIETASNVTTYLNANVTEIETDETGRAATRVRVATLARNRFAVRARHFVLATGGIENPRLLLASNRTRPRGIGNDRGLVGRFFLEHPLFEAAIVVPTTPDLRAGFYEPHRVRGTEIQGYISLTKEVQREEGLVDVQLLVRLVNRSDYERALDSANVESLRALAQERGGNSFDEMGRNLLNVVGDLTTGRRFAVPGAPLPVPYPEVVGKLLGRQGGVGDYVPELLGDIAAFGYARARGGPPLDHLVLRTRLDPAPNPDSRVTLDTQRDDLGMPRARLDWRLSRIDRHSAVRTVQIVGAAFARAGLGRLRVLIDEDGQDWPPDLSGGWHHMGTTRMSDSPRDGVVDRNCRVHDMANLFVAGSSVFTTGGSSTSTLTIVAMTLRLADHLKSLMR
ncbi:hypothetical protein BH20ACT13_BH20ACT13_10760 [soil metagenome]